MVDFVLTALTGVFLAAAFFVPLALVDADFFFTAADLVDLEAAVGALPPARLGAFLALDATDFLADFFFLAPAVTFFRDVFVPEAGFLPPLAAAVAVFFADLVRFELPLADDFLAEDALEAVPVAALVALPLVLVFFFFGLNVCFQPK